MPVTDATSPGETLPDIPTLRIDTNAPRNERTSFSYFKPTSLHEEEKPFQIFAVIPSDAKDQRSTNFDFEDGPEETVHDIRGNEASFTLNHNGFAVRRNISAVIDWEDQQAIKSIYLPEVEAILRQELEGVDGLRIIDWRKRKNVTLGGIEKIEIDDRQEYLPPARHPHVDQSLHNIVQRIQQHFPDEADKFLGSRIRLINVWRPTLPSGTPILDSPLAFCDAASTRSSDLVEVDDVRGSFAGSTLYGLYRPGLKWHYLSRMTRNEVLLLKMFDSEESTPAKFTIHTGFEIKDIPQDCVPRQSIEVRALVFTYVSEATRVGGQPSDM